MVNLNVVTKRISFDFPNRTLIPVLVPMFLIISSSVYPTIMSSTENEEMQTVSNVMAEQQQKVRIMLRQSGIKLECTCK